MGVEKWLTEDAEKISQSPKGGLHIEIENLEDLLDDCTGQNWSTQKFDFSKFGDDCFGSIELILNYVDSEGHGIRRCFVGASNFNIQSILPITDWAATLKSYCVKNAASDSGRKLGRHLNKGLLPDIQVGKDKRKVPDMIAKKQMADAVLAMNETKIADLKTQYKFDA